MGAEGLIMKIILLTDITTSPLSPAGGRVDVNEFEKLSELGLEKLFVEIPSGALTNSIELQISVPTDILGEKTAL